jgi:hypothetical protein
MTAAVSDTSLCSLRSFAAIQKKADAAEPFAREFLACHEMKSIGWCRRKSVEGFI